MEGGGGKDWALQLEQVRMLDKIFGGIFNVMFSRV